MIDRRRPIRRSHHQQSSVAFHEKRGRVSSAIEIRLEMCASGDRRGKYMTYPEGCPLAQALRPAYCRVNSLIRGSLGSLDAVDLPHNTVHVRP